MVSPKKGGPQRVTAKAKLPFASPFPKTKRDTHTHTPVAETDQTPPQGETETADYRGNGAPWSHAGSLLGHQCPPSPHRMARPSPCLSPQAALMPPGPGQRDQNGQQRRTGGPDIPPPRATEGCEFSRHKLQAPLLTGLGLQPTPGAHGPCQPCPAGSKSCPVRVTLEKSVERLRQ